MRLCPQAVLCNVVAVAAMSVGLHATDAHAVDIPLLNASFEGPAVSPPPGSVDQADYVSIFIDDWDKDGPLTDLGFIDGILDSGVFVNVPSGPIPAVGNADGPLDPLNQLGFMQVNTNADGTTEPLNTIWQETSTLFSADTSYTLTLGVGPSVTDPAAGGATLLLQVGYFAPSGGAFVAVATRVVGDSELKNPYDGALLADPGYPLLTDFSALGSSTGEALGNEIVVKLTQVGGTNGGFIFDHARLDASPVPEPGSIACLALAGAWCLRRRR